MNKKALLIILIIIIFPINIFSYSAHSEIHKYGFAALANDISTITYNPAGLFYLPKTYAELGFTTDNNFKFNQIALGYYLTSFPLISRYYYTSVNFSLSMSKLNKNEEYSIGLGGTLYDFIKYGTLIKYVRIPAADKKYLDFNLGTIINIIQWCKIGFSAVSIKNKEDMPLNFITGISFLPIPELILSCGANFDNKFKEMYDYSAGAELNVFEHYSILAGIQKYMVPFGLGFNFSPEKYKEGKRTRSYYREKIFLTCNYDKNKKKISKIIFSFYYRFHSFINKKSDVDEEKKIIRKDDLLKEQKELLEKAKIYFAEERLDDAKEEIEELLELGKTTRHARQARKLLKEIKRIETKLKRSKKR